MSGKTVVIACSTIRPELTKVMENLGCDYEVFFMDAILHDRPEELKIAVQAQLDALTDTELVLLPFGYCGGTTVGLKAGNFEMILPKTDDCITLFLGSMEARKAVPDEEYTFFLTQGWLTSERNILKEHARLSEKYSLKRADRVMQAMYRNYHAIGLVDSGLFPMDTQESESRQIANLLGVGWKVLPGTSRFLSRLLAGPHNPEQFLHIHPFETITRNHYLFGSNFCKT